MKYSNTPVGLVILQLPVYLPAQALLAAPDE